MSLRGILAALFPATLLLITLALTLWLVVAPSPLPLGLILATLYLLPLLCFRLVRLVSTIPERASRLETGYSAWWTAHQFQLIYDTIPTLEALLRLFPGVYSMWLRLWGSKVGKSVYWTPRIEISDRSLMDIGDRVLFGHNTKCYAHLISRGTGGLVLYAKRITIGNDVFLGGFVVIGPGVQIGDNVVLGTFSRVLPRAKISAGTPLGPGSDVLAGTPESPTTKAPR